MKQKKNFWEWLNEIYLSSRIPVAYSLFIYVAIVRFIPDSIFSPTYKLGSIYLAILALGLIILVLFFDIYKYIKKPEEKLPYFNNWIELTESGELAKAFKKRIDDDKFITINAIGVSSRFYWDYIRTTVQSYLAKDKSYKFSINIAILDPEYYEDLTFTTNDFKGKFRNSAIATISTVNNFISSLEKKGLSESCQVNLFKYKFLPPFYGLCFDDKFLFIGVPFWDKDEFKSSGQSYNLYVEDDEFNGSDKIKIYNSWLEYIKQNSKD